MGNVLRLAVAIGAVELAGVAGASFTAPAISGWYAELAKPSLNPPSWVFAPVWTALYALMGIAVFLMWREYDTLTLSEVEGFRKRQIKISLAIFSVQLFLNTAWSVVFFGLRSPGWALVEIAFLWLAILATVVSFAKISRLAAWLLAPYLLWVSFAVYLNYSIWALN